MVWIKIKNLNGNTFERNEEFPNYEFVSLNFSTQRDILTIIIQRKT